MSSNAIDQPVGMAWGKNYEKDSKENFSLAVLRRGSRLGRTRR